MGRAINRINHAGLAKGVLAFRRRVTLVVAQLRSTTSTDIGVNLVWLHLYTTLAQSTVRYEKTTYDLVIWNHFIGEGLRDSRIQLSKDRRYAGKGNENS